MESTLSCQVRFSGAFCTEVVHFGTYLQNVVLGKYSHINTLAIITKIVSSAESDSSRIKVAPSSTQIAQVIRIGDLNRRSTQSEHTPSQTTEFPSSSFMRLGGSTALSLLNRSLAPPLAQRRLQCIRACTTAAAATDMTNQAEFAKTLQAKPAPAGHKIIREGNGVMIFPEQNKVFYNNVQVLNRDLSISVISDFARVRAIEKLQKQEKKAAAAAGNTEFTPKEYAEEEIDAYLEENAETSGIKIFEALSASGLRSIRYFQQIPGVKSILVNDMDPAAVESIKRNIEFNELPLDRVIPNEDDATDVMCELASFVGVCSFCPA